MRLIGLGLVVAGAALLLLTGWLIHPAVLMPSYLATWLFWSSLPLGALPIVMMLDLAGPGAGFGLEPTLRRLLWLTPVAAVLIIPILVWPTGLFGWMTGHGFATPFARAWMTYHALVIRSVVYFALWIILALAFLRPPAVETVDRRRGLSAIGLFIYVVTATLASADYAMSVEPNWMSAEFGLLLMATQSAVAVSVALLLAGKPWLAAAPDAAASFLMTTVAAWLFLQFMQFLVIWSANKPADIAWFLHRSNLFSQIVVWLSVVLGGIVPLFALLMRGGRRHPAILPAMAGLVLCVQAVGMLWLITPSLRQYFTVSGLDIVALAGLGGVMMGLCLLPGAMPASLPVHAASGPSADA